MNTDASWPDLDEAERRVLKIQTKLHQWATDDTDRRFDDLFNLVTDPAFLTVAWARVRGNQEAGRRQPEPPGGTGLTLVHDETELAQASQRRGGRSGRHLQASGHEPRARLGDEAVLISNGDESDILEDEPRRGPQGAPPFRIGVGVCGHQILTADACLRQLGSRYELVPLVSLLH